MDQESFERGLQIGLNTALVLVREGKGTKAIEAQITELKESQEYRRNNGIIAGRAMEAADIFCPTPIAHPGDFGLLASSIDDDRVALSRMSFATLKDTLAS